MALNFPTTPILDNFNRADGALGSNWDGASYGDPNLLTISSNAVTSAALGFGAMCWVANKVGRDFEVYATVSTLPLATKTVRVISSSSATASSGLTGYYLVVNPTSSTFQLGDAADGSNIGASISQAFVAGDSFGFSRCNGLINILYKSGAGSWTIIGTRSDSRYGGLFVIGLELEDNVQRIDNFGGGILIRNRRTLSSLGTRIMTRQARN